MSEIKSTGLEHLHQFTVLSECTAGVDFHLHGAAGVLFQKLSKLLVADIRCGAIGNNMAQTEHLGFNGRNSFLSRISLDGGLGNRLSSLSASGEATKCKDDAKEKGDELDSLFHELFLLYYLYAVQQLAGDI